MYGMKITVTITKDDKDFSETEQRYSNMSYDNMQTAQGAIVRSLLALGDAKLSQNNPSSTQAYDHKR